VTWIFEHCTPPLFFFFSLLPSFPLSLSLSFEKERIEREKKKREEETRLKRKRKGTMNPPPDHSTF
jgi:hypothetical protein